MGKTYAGIGYGIQKMYDFKNKEEVLQDYISYMLNRTQSMFKYKGLPESIPQRNLELMIQTNGNVCITKVNDDLYAFTGGMGGNPNEYYMPTTYIVANPYLNFNKELTIDRECVVIPSDSTYMGLLPILRRYCSMLVENNLTMRSIDIMSRLSSLITAGSDNDKIAADKFIDDLESGKLSSVAENGFLEGIKVQPMAAAQGQRITDAIEYHQYIKAGLFNELGLQSNYNMKREAINSNESQLNEDMLLPLVDDMLRCRKLGIDKVNKMYGTHITVYLSSAWEDEQDPAEKEKAVSNDSDKSEEKPAEEVEEKEKENADT